MNCSRRTLIILLVLLLLLAAVAAFALLMLYEEPALSDQSSPVSTSIEIHFIDVGQGDAALILCDGQSMLIDGGDTGSSSLIYSYLEDYSVEHLNYIVATHAHEDHVGGLPGALNYATVDVALCPTEEYDSKCFRDFVKYLDEQGKSITVPDVGDTFTLGEAQVTVVGVNSDPKDTNNSSIYLRIDHGETSFLFTGDGEREAEEVVLANGYPLEVTVLKVPHHGSDTSSSYPFLRAVSPEYAVISVGTGNTYGHPTEDALSRLRDAEAKVFRTDLQGHIVCRGNGSEVTFTLEKNPNADTLFPAPSKQETHDYIGNVNSHLFHYATCENAAKTGEKNRFYYTGTRQEMLDMGYTPCQNCNP